MSRVPSNFLYYHQTESTLRQFIAPLFSDTRVEIPHNQIDKYHVHSQLLISFQITCPSPRSCVTFRNVRSLAQTPNLEYHNLVGCLPLLIRYIRSYPPCMMTRLLHTQPEGQPCRGDRRLLNMHQYLWRIFIATRHKHYVWRLCVIM